MKIPPVEAELIHADRQITDKMKLIAFHSFAKAPNIRFHIPEHSTFQSQLRQSLKCLS
jgi:hypothetical protein